MIISYISGAELLHVVDIQKGTSVSNSGVKNSSQIAVLMAVLIKQSQKESWSYLKLAYQPSLWLPPEWWPPPRHRPACPNKAHPSSTFLSVQANM
jgi:hypothetical protein